MGPAMRDCLWGLRIYGPCSNVELARKLGRDREAVYGSVYKLRELGLADRMGEASYDVTEAGRAFLEGGGEAAADGLKQLSLFGDKP
jgi:Mn-dependent DtxR family transcriptional regulator